MSEEKQFKIIPKRCDSCRSINISFCDNKIIYGKSIGEWPFVYFCNDCRASVRCHKNTNIPLGYMANWRVKKLRNKAHVLFDVIWKEGYISRDDAYIWLAKQLNLTEKQCHFSLLGIGQLKKAIALCENLSKKDLEKIKRRKEKQEERHYERNEREHKQQQRYSRSRKRRR